MTTQWQEITIINGEEIDLHLVKTVPGNPTKNWVPAYHFNMALKGSDTPIGVIDLRIGHNENLSMEGISAMPSIPSIGAITMQGRRCSC